MGVGADFGLVDDGGKGLEQQIQEIKESVELPLTHPELYEEMGIKPPKGTSSSSPSLPSSADPSTNDPGVILYGVPGTGKTLLAKAVANQTSATFLRIVGSELIQKYLGDGPKLVRELFRVAEELAPSIVFIDEIDAIGTKRWVSLSPLDFFGEWADDFLLIDRYDSNSGGEREIQRTMLELLNQLDGFDSRGDVKVIMATNKIETLDPALIRPGRIDRKIEFPYVVPSDILSFSLLFLSLMHPSFTPAYPTSRRSATFSRSTLRECRSPPTSIWRSSSTRRTTSLERTSRPCVLRRDCWRFGRGGCGSR